MRIELSGLIQKASGPYGGREQGLRLTTNKHGVVTAVPRKGAMTGELTNPLHAWARLHWIAVDAYWKTLPQRIRAEWGKCGRRTKDLAQSNLDQFRKVNLPRAMTGFPPIRLPPAREDSQCIYVERPADPKRINRAKPMQIWILGKEKPEPPWIPGDPLDPEPRDYPEPGSQKDFALFEGDAPNSIIQAPHCWADDCQSSIAHCAEHLYAWPLLTYAPALGKSYFRWAAPHAPDASHENPTYQIKNEIHSQQIWYDDVPYRKMLASHLECRSGTWDDYELPPGNFWCLELTHWSSPGVELSYARYIQQKTTTCPRGFFTLVYVDDVHDEYPWPLILTIQQSKPVPSIIIPCPGWRDEDADALDISAFWHNTQNPQWLAGLAWRMTESPSAAPVLSYNAGPAYSNVSSLSCASTGPLTGHWHFTLNVQIAGEYTALLYAKPNHIFTAGPLGHYWLMNDGPEAAWATPTICVWKQKRDWSKDYPTVAECVGQQVIAWVAMALLGRLVHLAYEKWRMMRLADEVYSFPTMYKAAHSASYIPEKVAEYEYRCHLIRQGLYGPPIKVGSHMANEAWLRMRTIAKAAHKAKPWPLP